MEVALIILNYNGKFWLSKFLPLLLEKSCSAKIYVVDNASADDSVSFLQNTYPEAVTTISFENNYGFAAGYNRACKLIEADLYGLINNDIEVTENWLFPIIEVFEKYPEIAIAQPKICDYHKRAFFEYAGGAGGYLDALGYAYCRGRLFSTLEKDSDQYRYTDDLHWASGSCFFIRSAVFETTKGFDATFFMHQEEIDLCWRVKGLGYKIACVSDSKVFHVGGATLSHQNPKKVYYNFRNSLLMLTKNLPWYWLFPVIFIRLLLDGLAGLFFIKQGKYQDTLAVIKAHYAFFLRLPRYVFLPSSGRLFHYISSLIVFYFLKKKIYFSQLPKHKR